ncbi:hypothetical protein [Leifsonia xyli]|uniref:hypothetical protein n=1 Tax=Leifsonia xyli TaxID=1575 RepID=UPI000423CBE1|nr:hypothetical protein [Leifsonia xyli]
MIAVKTLAALSAVVLAVLAAPAQAPVPAAPSAGDAVSAAPEGGLPSGNGPLIVVRKVVAPVGGHESKTDLYGSVRLIGGTGPRGSSNAFAVRRSDSVAVPDEATVFLSPNALTGNRVRIAVDLWDAWIVTADMHQATGVIDTSGDSAGQHTVTVHGEDGRTEIVTYSKQTEWQEWAITRIKLTSTDYSDPADVYGYIDVCADGPDQEDCQDQAPYTLFDRARSTSQEVWKGANILDTDHPVFVYSKVLGPPGHATIRTLKIMPQLFDSRFWQADGRLSNEQVVAYRYITTPATVDRRVVGRNGTVIVTFSTRGGTAD